VMRLLETIALLMRPILIFALTVDGRTRPGNERLRTVLTQLAHAATRTRGTYRRPCTTVWRPAGRGNGA
jgi:hypothetical protein